MKLRYSQLAMLAYCPRQYELRYVYGVRPAIPSYLVLGKGCHYALAQNFTYKLETKQDLPLGDMLDLFSDAWEKQEFGSHDYPGEKDDPIIWEEPKDVTKDIGVLLLRAYHQELAPKVEPLMVEQDFSKEVGGITLASRLDLVATSGIIDYKCVKRRKTPEEADRDIQPTCHMLVSGSVGIPYEFHLLLKHKIPKTDTVKTTRSQAQIDWFVNQFIPPIAKMISQGIFPPLGATTWMCHPEHCGFYSMCRR